MAILPLSIRATSSAASTTVGKRSGHLSGDAFQFGQSPFHLQVPLVLVQIALIGCAQTEHVIIVLFARDHFDLAVEALIQMQNGILSFDRIELQTPNDATGVHELHSVAGQKHHVHRIGHVEHAHHIVHHFDVVTFVAAVLVRIALDAASVLFVAGQCGRFHGAVQNQFDIVFLGLADFVRMMNAENDDAHASKAIKLPIFPAANGRDKKPKMN